MNRRLLKGEGEIGFIADRPLDKQLTASESSSLALDMMRGGPRLELLLLLTGSHEHGLAAALVKLRRFAHE